jgi:26S proteasome regulatory subunit N8
VRPPDNRLAKDTKKRVVGMLLGSVSKGVVDITNCYAVPFEEDERDLKIWYLDHSYHEQMFAMFKKVNASEKLVGWYTTGPKIRPGDLQIDALVRRYTPNPVMVIIDVKPKALGIPTEAYHAVEEIREGQQQSWTFKHVQSEIGASEPEEVGVEHLLRDVKDMTISTLAVKPRPPCRRRAPLAPPPRAFGSLARPPRAALPSHHLAFAPLALSPPAARR